MRKRLAAAEERKAATRREMHDKGIATLQICPACGLCFDHLPQRCTADGSRLEAPRLLPFVLLGRYQLERVLGQGGMGIVFSAHDEKLGREVAIKLIRPEHFGDRDVKNRFEREARMVARIQHPGVVALFDSGELEDGTAFLVMERLAGFNLRALLKRSGPGTTREVARLVRQGAAALGAAHRAGIVHRDIKPENVFLVNSETGFVVKLLDFGIAKPMSLERGLTQSGALVGTPHYMPPEQIQGQEVDSRSDLYSFATVCYEALTGRRAVKREGFANVLLEVLSTAPERVSDLLPGIPLEIDEAFARAFAKDPRQRSVTLEAWAQALGDALERLPCGPEDGWTRLRTSAETHAFGGSASGDKSTKTAVRSDALVPDEPL
jgi:serine/threonine protein kinase